MIVGFDVSQTGRFKAGCGYFADSLIRALVPLDPSTRFVLYPTFGAGVWDDQWPRSTVQLKAKNVRRGLAHRTLADLETFWSDEPHDLDVRLSQPDIVHSNNFFCPTGLRHARLVYTLYDLAFVHHPEWTTEENRVTCFDGVFGASIRADHLIAISRATRDDFLDVFPHVPPERVSVVYPASRFAEPGPSRRPSALAAAGAQRFWLSVATLEPRKNHLRMLRAYARHVAQHPADALPLVLAGGRGWLMDDLDRQVDELQLRGRVVLTGYVDDAELRWLYEHCFAFVYASVHEGFGLPVLEAMSVGAAVISSNATSLPEIVADAGLLVDPLDEMAIGRAFERLHTDETLRRSLQQRAQPRSAAFSWRTAARQVDEIYRELLARKKVAQ